MLNLFRKRPAPPATTTLKQIEDRLLVMETMLSQASTGGTHYHIHVEHLAVDRPVLENLTFRLDRLDIEELSGSLNLGNNFQADALKDKAASAGKPPAMPAAGTDSGADPEPSTRVRTTPKGFSFRPQGADEKPPFREK